MTRRTARTDLLRRRLLLALALGGLVGLAANCERAAAAQEVAAEEVTAEELPEVEIVPDSAKDAKPSATRDAPAVAELIVEQTNAFRREQGLKDVAVSQPLTATAADFARYMARTHRYDHRADGRTPAERAIAHKYDYCIVLENIAYQYNSEGFSQRELATRTAVGWQESPEHRENIVDPDVTETGVAVAQSEDTGYFFAVQMFGRPKSARIKLEVVNRSDVELKYELDEKDFPLLAGQIRTHTRCRPPKMVVHWPKTADAAAREPQKLQPKNGERFVIARAASGKLDIARETLEK